MTMNQTAAARPRDPVCGMSVRPDTAEEEGLMLSHEGHSYFFCREACRDRFVAGPDMYVNSHSHAADVAPAASLQIDDGMRRWYESCSCCLSDAHPEVKAALDAERAAEMKPAADPGICEVAEAEVEAAR